MKTIQIEVPDEVADDLIEKYAKKKKDRPEEDEEYRFINKFGYMDMTIWLNDDADNHALSTGNCFWGKDKKKACEMYKLRLQSMAKAWIPKEGEECWYWNFEHGVLKASDGFEQDYLFLWATSGACFRTKEECEEWGKKYSKAFEYLTKKK